MTRDEVIKGLELVLECGYGDRAETFVRAVLDLLRVPTVAEIEAARKRVVNIYNGEGPENFFAPIRATIYRALDALARAPRLETQVEYLSELRDSLSRGLEEHAARVAALSAKLARVRELCGEWVDVFGIEETVPNANIGRVVKLIDAALADEATK